MTELETQGDTEGDLLLNVEKHLPEQVGQMSSVLQSLQSGPPDIVRGP